MAQQRVSTNDGEDSFYTMKSKAMRAVYEVADNVAGYNSTLLIIGKSGVGKEVLIKRIHQISPRRNGPFIRINCGAIPENLMESEMFGYAKGAFTGAVHQGKLGLISLADQGTLVLDEIGELSMAIQVKLLRVLQERRFYPIGGVKPVTVDVRLIAATNRDLKSMVKDGSFREDLYYRLNVVPIRLPSLCECQEDIPGLIEFFLANLRHKYKKECNITAKAIRSLIRYDWPGNIRELGNVVERLVVTTSAKTIDDCHLPHDILDYTDDGIQATKGQSLKEFVAEYESRIIKESISKNRTLSKASRELKVDVSTLSRKCKKYKIPI